MLGVDKLSAIYREKTSLSPIYGVVNYHPTLLCNTDPLCKQHWHENYELLLVTEGALVLHYQGLRFTAHEGDMLCINPNDIHMLSLHPDYSFSWHDCIHIHPSLLENSGFTAEKFRLFPLIRKTEANNYYRRFVNTFSRKQTTDLEIHNFRIRSEALALIGFLLDNFSHTPSSQRLNINENLAIIKHLISYIQAHLNEPITLEILSKEVNYSKAYVCRIIRTYMNTTAVDLINILRCQRAQFLLLREGISVSECVGRCGFNTFSYFSKTYYKHIGEYPSATKKKAILAK